MHNTALIAQRHIRARQHIIRDGLPKNFHTEHICYYLLGLALDIGVYEGDMVVTAYHVPKC